MVIGLDYNGVITAFPNELRHLARAVMLGGEVHIISAVKPWNKLKTEEKIRQASIPNTAIHVLTFKDYNEIANLKYQLIRSLGIEMFLDDHPETVFLLNSNGILGCKVEGYSNRGTL